MPKSLKIIFFLLLGILIFPFLVYKIPLTKVQKTQILTKPLASAEKTLNKLTLEQKIGQLFIIGFEGKTLTPQLENLIKTIHPGGVLLLSRNIESENQLRKLIGDLQEISLKDDGLLLFIAVDQEGEPMSRIKFLSEKTPQSKIQDIEQAYEVGFNRGKELKNLGINLNLAPILDITQPSDFLYSRSFQKNPEDYNPPLAGSHSSLRSERAPTIGELAKALISGQKLAGILTAIKHFPGYGGIPFNPEREKLPILAKIPEISQFKTVLEADPEIIMTSNVIYLEVDESFPFTLSQKAIQFLKTELKNNFLIISDDLSSPVLKKSFSLENSITLAVKAGVDILIIAGFDTPEDSLSAFNFLLEAAKTGQISEKRINESIFKTIKLKQKLLK